MERGANGTVSHTMSWRVKLYQLNDVGEWDDKGTGHITCAYSEVRAAPASPQYPAYLRLVMISVCSGSAAQRFAY